MFIFAEVAVKCPDSSIFILFICILSVHISYIYYKQTSEQVPHPTELMVLYSWWGWIWGTETSFWTIRPTRSQLPLNLNPCLYYLLSIQAFSKLITLAQMAKSSFSNHFKFMFHLSLMLTGHCLLLQCLLAHTPLLFWWQNDQFWLR